MQIASPVAVGGVTLAGEYTVTTVADVNTYTITAASPAVSTVSSGGGSVTLTYLLGVGFPNARATFGWGGGSWGKGTWGTPRASLVSAGQPRIWSLDNWGEELVACPRDGGVYDWKPTTGLTTRAAVISGAPLYNKGILVGLPDRHLIAFGAEVDGTQDPLLVRWSDVEDYTSWTAAATNSAGSFRIVGGTQIMCWAAAASEILIWTDQSLYSMRFQGLPYVYGFYPQGDYCGVIGPQAGTVHAGVAYWMGQRSFYMYSGQVRPLDCPVWDTVFRNMNTFQAWKVRAAVNAGFTEVTWFYPSATATENDSYVTLNTLTGDWTIGRLARTAWVDAGLTLGPIGAAPNGKLYSHEVGTDADGAAMNPYVQSGFWDMADGEEFSFTDQIIPDFNQQTGSVLLTLTAQAEPNGATTTKGPFMVQPTTKRLSPRLRGRQLALRVESNSVGAWWRLGAVRLRVAPDGQK